MMLQIIFFLALMSLQLLTLVFLVVTQFARIAIAVALFGLMLLEVFFLSTFVPFLAIFFSLLVIATVVIVIVRIASVATVVTSVIPGLRCGSRIASDCRDNE